MGNDLVDAFRVRPETALGDADSAATDQIGDILIPFAPATSQC
jgi:hypothetical protein